MNAATEMTTGEEVTTSPSGKPLTPSERAIVNAGESFAQVANGLDFNVERIFAMQALMKTDYAVKVANANPRSVRLAMLNLAATGLTLNPANQYAFLVPRDNEIKLDISYKGLIKIATDAGSIRWAKADLVHELDAFRYLGPAKEPIHEAEVFRDRGPMIGVYCIARTRDGDTLTDYMSLADIHKIRSKSDLWARKKSGPWVEFEGEMTKKAMIKRASKTWPYTDRSERIFKAIEIANDAEGGYTFEGDPLKPFTAHPTDGVGDDFSEEQTSFLLAHAAAIRDVFDSFNFEELAERAKGAEAANERLYALNLDADEFTYVWKEFPSGMRTAMTKARKS